MQKSVIKGIRFSQKEIDEIEIIAKKRGLNFSEFIKEAVLFYQKNPHEQVEELTQKVDQNFEISQTQSDHIDRLAKVMLVQKEKYDELEILIKRIFNQSLYSYKSIQFTMKNAQGNPAWQKVLDDIKSQAIDSNHPKGE